MKRGQIYFIKSNYHEEGSEQRANRPAVIVSNNANNEHSECVEVVYMTTKPKTDLPTHVLTRSALVPSTILCEQICTVSKQRVETLIGELTENELQALDTALLISLGINLAAGEQEQATDETEQTENSGSFSVPTEAGAELVKALVERDIYRNMYHETLELLLGARSR